MTSFNSNLSALYREVVLDHARQPRNQRKLAQPSHQMELLNPTCGDALMIQILVEEDQIVEAAFTGYGCSISIASASMMTEALTGLNVAHALHLIAYFNQLVGGTKVEHLTGNQTGNQEKDQEILEDALKDAVLLEGVKQFPARYKCAVLAWKAAESAFLKDSKEDDRSSETIEAQPIQAKGGVINE